MNNLKKYFNDYEFEQLKNCSDLECKALTIVLRLFDKKLDKSGEPYLGHLLRVCNGVHNVVARAAALLHDTIEDIPDITYEDLFDVGVPSEVLNIVSLVTRDKSMPYEDEITRIIESNNMDAINIKISDMTDNSNEARLEKLDAKTKIKLRRKYGPQLIRLRKVKSYD